MSDTPTVPYREVQCWRSGEAAPPIRYSPLSHWLIRPALSGQAATLRIRRLTHVSPSMRSSVIKYPPRPWILSSKSCAKGTSIADSNTGLLCQSQTVRTARGPFRASSARACTRTLWSGSTIHW